MPIYTDYEFYVHSYYGKIIEDSFDFLFFARKASQIIKRFTFGKIPDNEIPECVQMCCCELVELLYNSKTDEEGYSSEKVGDWSVTYESSKEREAGFNRKIKSAIYDWLSDTEYLYRGVSC